MFSENELINFAVWAYAEGVGDTVNSFRPSEEDLRRRFEVALKEFQNQTHFKKRHDADKCL